MYPGSELKLLKGLELGCSGIITATCNVTAQISRKVYDDFFSGAKQLNNNEFELIFNSLFNIPQLVGIAHPRSGAIKWFFFEIY